MKLRRATLALAAACLLAGCVAAPPPPTEVFYRFHAAEGPSLPAPVIEGALRVERLRAEGILSERALLFTQEQATGRLEQYRYHHWSEPPAQLLTQGLIHYLQAAGVAGQVMAADVRSEVDYSIDGNLLRLERILGRNQDQVALEIALRLQKFSSRELLLQQRYLEVVEVESDSMTEVINAFSRARERIYTRFVEDLRVLEIR